MTIFLRLAALAAAAALAACGTTTTTQPTAALAEPSAVAVFRGVTPKSADLRPYIAVANAATNDLTIVDAIDDTLVEAPAPLRGLVYPIPGRPVLLASGDLGDREPDGSPRPEPDLLVAVTAGDLPTLGGSRLAVIRTWRADGSIAGEVELGGDVLALVALPPDPARDPAAPAQVKVAAALAGERIAVVTFERVDGSTAIDVAAAQASVVTNPVPLGFQPVDLAAIPGVPDRVWAASRDLLPDGFHGVAEIDVTGTPALARQLDALAPTRLVAALRLAEWSPPAGPNPDFVGTAGFGTARPERVYAVLDESGCGVQAPIACGLVALDPASPPRAGGGHLVLDPTTATTFQAPYRAPIPVGHALALGASLPPAVLLADPQYAGTYMRIALNTGLVTSTGAAAVASADGFLTFVDLGRWLVPSQQSVFGNVTAKVASTRPPGTAASQTQWLVLERRGGGGFASHLDPAALSTAVTVTGGYTPTDRWTVTQEGVLPGLSSRGAEVWNDGGTPLLASQATGVEGVSAVVRLYDPTLAVSTGDTVVIEPNGLGTCTTFEAEVADLVAPEPARPGGAVHLTPRTLAANPEWDRCLAALATAAPAPGTAQAPIRLRATFRAGGYVLTRGTGAAAVHVGRPELGAAFAVEWKPEDPGTCTLPPAVAWPVSGLAPSCTGTCRTDCESLTRARLARRIGYVAEPPFYLAGPALGFTLAVEVLGAPVPRDFALIIDTAEGRAPFRASPTAGSPVDPRAVVPFDRSPYYSEGGVRFLVPYAGNALLDASPTQFNGGVHTIR